MNYRKYILITLMTFIMIACGDPAVNIQEVEYDQKIVVEAVISPSEKIDGIKLMRNFPLETGIDSLELYLDPEVNSVSATINGEPLSFDENTRTYYLDNTAEYDKDYTLNVSAVIDDVYLECSSTTHTPAEGFELTSSDLGIIKYREEKPLLFFHTSPGSDAYAFSIRPMNATLDNFIYDNPYEPNKERDDLEENFGSYLYQLDVLININSFGYTTIPYQIKELDMWFYTDYEVIAYAADKNYKDYLITAGNVQEPDGNFVQPVFHFNGDGIGLFGSAVRDTLTFTLVK